MRNITTIQDAGIEIIGGQIMSRIIARDGKPVAEVRRVISPKSISDEGSIAEEEIETAELQVPVPEQKLTAVGDIVVKLSAPYGAALVTEEAEGCVVPSFCAILKCPRNIDAMYLLAFLNSEVCKSQLKAQMGGATIAMASVGKLGKVIIPLPTEDEQIDIGKRYASARNNLLLMRQIAALEVKRNDLVFKGLVKDNG